MPLRKVTEGIAVDDDIDDCDYCAVKRPTYNHVVIELCSDHNGKGNRNV